MLINGKEIETIQMFWASNVIDISLSSDWIAVRKLNSNGSQVRCSLAQFYRVAIYLSIRRTTTSGPAIRPIYHLQRRIFHRRLLFFLLLFYSPDTCRLTLWERTMMLPLIYFSRSQFIAFYLPSCVQLLQLPSAQMQVNITSKSSCKYLYVIRLYLHRICASLCARVARVQNRCRC